MRYLCTVLILMCSLSPAAAEIRINQSRFQDGKLVVSGDTDPRQTVTLDNEFKTKSDATGHFKFTLKYKPPTCMSDINVGGSIYSAVIAGCLNSSFGDDRLPIPPISGKRLN